MDKIINGERRSYFHGFYCDRTKDEDRNYECGRAFYTSDYNTVSIFFHTGYKSITSHTTLEIRHGGTEYWRTYNRTFSDRGLQMVAARFAGEIHNKVRAGYKKIFQG